MSESPQEHRDRVRMSQASFFGWMLCAVVSIVGFTVLMGDAIEASGTTKTITACDLALIMLFCSYVSLAEIYSAYKKAIRENI